MESWRNTEKDLARATKLYLFGGQIIRDEEVIIGMRARKAMETEVPRR